MKNRDFIQQAVIEFLPQLNWDIDKAIAYAEKLHKRLDEKGYGDSKPTGPREIKKPYEKLKPAMKTAFDRFWLAFDYKHGKAQAAGVWLQMGELNKQQYDQIIKAAKQEAQRRKQLPEGMTPIMAQGWLSQERWQDFEETGTEKQKKQQDQTAAKIREITSALNHAKAMNAKTEDEYWPKEVQRLTEQLKQLRQNNER